jgi:hypothetical protein
MVRSLVNNERCGRKLSYPDILPDICFEGRRNTTKTFSQGSTTLGCELNPGHLEYAKGVLWLRRPALTVLKPRILNIRLEANSATGVAYRRAAV